MKYEDYKKRSTARIARGMCPNCGEPALEHNQKCLKHWLKTFHKKDAPIERWYEQNGTCAYTGEKLIPGLTASLDHRLPLTRGGNDAKSNLQWVTKTVNSMKTTLTHDEFIAKCAEIARKAGAL